LLPQDGRSLETALNSSVLIPELPNVIAPPFTIETAVHKVRAAEDAWNSRDPDRGRKKGRH
jgi:hypothetical protein